MARHHRNKNTNCPNCGTALGEDFEFCPKCGQENHDLRLPFRLFAYEFIESITHFDTKLWNTLKVIFTRPGQLTKDFAEGKRARYVNPARFYVFVSFIFFALLTLVLDKSIEPKEERTDPSDRSYLRSAELQDAVPDSIARVLALDSSLRDHHVVVEVPIDKPYYRAFVAAFRDPSTHELDSLLAGAPNDTVPGTRQRVRAALGSLRDVDSLNVSYHVRLRGFVTSFSRRYEEAIMRKEDLTDADVDSLLGADRDSTAWWKKRALRSLGHLDLASKSGRERMNHLVVRAVSVVMFILMPFTAVLLLWIFYRRRYYWEHLIFSIHIHSIYFLFFSLLLGLGLMLPVAIPAWASLGLVVLCALYLLAALHRVYARSWPVTILRAALMTIPYLVASIFLLAAGVVWGFFSL